MVNQALTLILILMSPPSSHFADSAIEQMRAEIIAQDWQLSSQRITRLREAFAHLSAFFKNRSHALALLRMACSVLDHIDQQGCDEANALDFLKEDMAHIVNLYEDDEYDPERTEQTVRRAYKRFLRLNINLTKEEFQPVIKTDHSAPLLETLEALFKEASQLQTLLDQTGPLSPEDNLKATALLGKIAAAINITWARLPSPSNRE